MSIDLWTLLAQIINFIILIALLKHFLYKPLLLIVEQRQKMIQDKLDAAEHAQTEAQNQLRQYQEQLAQLDKHKKSLLSDVQKQADALKEKLLTENKEQANLSLNHWRQELSQAKKAFDENLQKAILENFKSFAQNALTDIADTELSTKIISCFVEKLTKLPAKSKQKFVQSVLQTHQITVCTDMKLDKTEQQNLSDFILQWIETNEKIHFVYKQDKQIISGICLQSAEQLIQWNLSVYLQDFEHNMDIAFNELLQQN